MAKSRIPSEVYSSLEVPRTLLESEFNTDKPTLGCDYIKITYKDKSGKPANINPPIVVWIHDNQIMHEADVNQIDWQISGASGVPYLDGELIDVFYVEFKKVERLAGDAGTWEVYTGNFAGGSTDKVIIKDGKEIYRRHWGIRFI